jgi:CRP-like cAMP-binding protein
MLSKDRLKKITLFRELSDSDIEKVGSILEEAFFNKGSMVWEEGVTEQGLHIIDYGKVKVWKKTSEDHKQVLAVLKADNFFGEISMLDGRSHSASVEALEDTKVFVLNKSKMDKLLEDDPKIAFSILKVMMIEVSALLRVMNAKFMDIVNYVWE